MCFLKALGARNFICIRKPTTWVGCFLFVMVLFTISTANAIPPFQEFKKDLGSSEHLKLIAIVDPESINLGDQFVLLIKIEVSEGWHIYSLESKKDDEESLATKISLNSGSFLPQGSWEEPTPTIGWDGALEKVVKKHNQTVEFRRWYRVAESLALGSHRINGSIMFRACNNKICTLPNEVSFKAEIKVLDDSS